MPDVVDPKITPTWLAVYEFIQEYWLENGYAPSQNDIRKAVKCSIASIQNAFRTLKERGHIDWQKFEQRSVHLVDLDRRIFRSEEEAAAANPPVEPEPKRERRRWDDLDTPDEWEV